ncbi:MAG: Aldehyde dehydrogenase, partial [Parcubacteria group bacterium GW2011_GWA1_48_11b]
MERLASVNPSNYQILGEVMASDRHEVEEKVRLARKAQKEWANLGLDNRVTILRRVVEEFKRCKETFATLESREMGMPINEALMDYDGTLAFAEWYLNNAEKYLSPETTFENESEIHQVFREPEECPLSGRMIEFVVSRILPEGVFSEVYGDGRVGQYLVQQDVNMIGFVGSCKTGWSLYETAGNKKIKAVMELGGSAPGIVFEDADIDAAVRSICEYRLTNCGQYCDGMKRLIVHQEVLHEVVTKLAEAFSARKIGVADNPKTELGPLVSSRQLMLLREQVRDAKRLGARVMAGGHSLEADMGGAFFQPTVLTDICGSMRVWNEEVFGPVLPVVCFVTEEEAIELANQTSYGLGSYVYTADPKRAERVARGIQS